MQLSKSDLEVLSNFKKINESLKFDAGNVICTTNTLRHMYAKAKLSVEFPRTFAIYDLDRFLRIMNTARDAELEFSERNLTIVKDSMRLNYAYCDPDLLITPERIPVAWKPENVYTAFTLPADTFQKAVSVMEILDHSGLCIVGEGGVLKLQTFNDKNTTDAGIFILGETPLTFNIILDRPKLIMLAETYTVSISKRMFTHFASEKVEYWLPPKQGSVLS